MKIEARCAHCGRDFMLAQLLVGPGLSGRCPWCGTILAPHYTEHLIETARRLERAGTDFEDALTALRGGWARFAVERGSVVGRIDALLDDLAAAA